MIGIAGYGGVTAAGPGTDALWNALTCGTDFQPATWPGDRLATSRERLLQQLMVSYREARTHVDVSALGRLGVILASTKGFVEDVIWREDADLNADALSPLLGDFLRVSELQPTCATVLSNACSSALSALYLAKAWMASGRAESVLILAVDEVGPFVSKGFQVLHALTAGRSRPFAAERDGLKLGEGAAAVFLSARIPCEHILSGVGVDAEGYAVTRPSPSGESLGRCLNALPGAPDLILAHGTGTVLNDQVEDQVFFQRYGRAPVVTGSKWSIGHTLAACGALDLILACEILRRQTAFALGNTTTVDARFQSRYLTAGSDVTVQAKRVMISSLGFGGIHAATQVEVAP